MRGADSIHSSLEVSAMLMDTVWEDETELGDSEMKTRARLS